MKLVNIRAYRHEDAHPLVTAANKDQHGVYFPSFVYEKEGQIVGYYSVAVPVVLSWQDRDKVTPLDSVKILGHIEGTLAGTKFISIPCDPESPYMRFLPQQGYTPYTKPVTLFIKEH
ncbi:MAG: hypothetical protein KGL39_08645 [Patescibacteria group bacterium]|nr:hypothetical protein [Patescibacteria group bacterium]